MLDSDGREANDILLATPFSRQMSPPVQTAIASPPQKTLGAGKRIQYCQMNQKAAFLGETGAK